MRLQRLAPPALGGAGGPFICEEALGHPDGAQPPRARLARDPAGDAHQLQRAAAEIEHAAVAERRGVHRRQIAVAGLLLAAENAHVKAGALAHEVEKLPSVLGVADRAGGHGVDLARPETCLLASGREFGEGLQPALNTSIAQPAAGEQPLADAHRARELLLSLPTVRVHAEENHAKRVGPKVYDRDALSRRRLHD